MTNDETEARGDGRREGYSEGHEEGWGEGYLEGWRDDEGELPVADGVRFRRVTQMSLGDLAGVDLAWVQVIGQDFEDLLIGPGATLFLVTDVEPDDGLSISG